MYTNKVGRLMLATLLAAGMGGAWSAEDPLVECKFIAALTDSDPAGSAVRDKPALEARVVARLNGVSSDIVTVTGFQNGWFRVSEAENDPDPPQKSKTVFKGPGFVAAGLLSREVSVKDKTSGALYEEPSVKSKLTANLQPEGLVHIVACKGAWLKLRGHVAADVVEGWMPADSTCLSTRSTC